MTYEYNEFITCTATNRNEKYCKRIKFNGGSNLAITENAIKLLYFNRNNKELSPQSLFF
jgi:hypothetical protein